MLLTPPVLEVKSFDCSGMNQVGLCLNQLNSVWTRDSSDGVNNAWVPKLFLNISEICPNQSIWKKKSASDNNFYGIPPLLLTTVTFDLCQGNLWRIKKFGAAHNERQCTKDYWRKASQQGRKHETRCAHCCEDGYIPEQTRIKRVCFLFYSSLWSLFLSVSEKSFRECFLSRFFLWHLLWLSVMQLRHLLFIGTLNPMLQRLTAGEPSLGKHKRYIITPSSATTRS